MTTNEGSTHISIDEIHFEQSTPALDYVDFVSHLGPDFMSSRKPAPVSTDALKTAQIARDAAHEALQVAEADAKRYATIADDLTAYLVKRAERALMRKQGWTPETSAQSDALTDALDAKARLAFYRVVNARSTYLLTQARLDALTAEK